ncbi:MAG: gluconokinase [Acidobacteria bacterium]|nr:gluconokinase [Acidobacteriota bacterium]MCA1638178.1 gluconokinase [Acidobacteriota bacterium]
MKNKTKNSFVLALDIGTSSVRAALYDFAGNVLPETFVKNERRLTATEDGGAEIDADVAFSQVIKAIDNVLKVSQQAAIRIEYVAASSFWHSLVGIDERGKATTKVFGWADTRSREYVSVLRENFDENDTHNRTGCRFHSSYWTAKLLWLQKEHRDVFKKTTKWLSFSDYAALRLFGKSSIKTAKRRLNKRGGHLPIPTEITQAKGSCFTSVSMASGTGIFDIRRNVWDEELLKFLKIEKENLPEVVESDSQTFQLNEKYIKHWAKLKNAKWFPAIGDGAANNIGANCLQKSKAALMIGTSGAIRVAFAGEPPGKIPNGLWCYRIDRKRIIIGGALSDGGGLYRWLKDTHKINDIDDIVEAEIEKREPDAHGLTFLPFLAGERSTGYNESAHGAILGLQSATDSIDIVQAALESVAYRFAEIYDQLNDVCKIREIIASGGALRESPLWTQIIADVLAENLSLPETREASSRGAVLLALETIGKIKDIAEIEMPKGQNFEFDKKRNAIYQEARERHKKFYKLLI